MIVMDWPRGIPVPLLAREFSSAEAAGGKGIEVLARALQKNKR